MAKIEMWQLKQRQAMPLWMKEAYTAKRIKSWYDHFDGEVYVSFSGGKDSTVLLDQVRKLYPDVPAVFVNTGQEYAEIIRFVRSIDNVIWLKPKMTFWEVVAKYGWPVVSKNQARFIHDLQNPTESNKATRNLRLTGLNRKGILCPSMKLSKKWMRLVDAPFKISEKCCEVLKKEPFKRYGKSSGRFPMSGVMAGDSRMRTRNYQRNGCNMFDATKYPISSPMAFWLEADIWEYIEKHSIPYSKIYDMGEKRTGCKFCMFGAHLEKEPNRFQRMKKNFPGQYDLFVNKKGGGAVLDCIGVKY